MSGFHEKRKLPLVIATGNQGKLREFRELLIDFPFNIISQPKGLKVEEKGLTFLENAALKASQVSKASGCWALADDSGLSVEALHGAPGIHSARYAKTDEERITKLLKAMESSSNRNAQFVSALCLASGENILIEVEGFCEGRITQFPRGENGFGYDPIFEVLSNGLTFAEMDLAQKKLIGHRGKAFNCLRPRLIELLSKS